jgi:hypothetical protein
MNDQIFKKKREREPGKLDSDIDDIIEDINRSFSCYSDEEDEVIRIPLKKIPKRDTKTIKKFKMQVAKAKTTSLGSNLVYEKSEEQIRLEKYEKLLMVNKKNKIIKIYDENSEWISDPWIPKLNNFPGDVILVIVKYYKVSDYKNALGYIKKINNLENVFARIKIWKNDQIINKLIENVVLVSQGDNLFFMIGKDMLDVQDDSIDFLILKTDQIFLDAYFWRPYKKMREDDGLTEEESKELNEIYRQTEIKKAELNNRNEEKRKVDETMNKLIKLRAEFDKRIEALKINIDSGNREIMDKTNTRDRLNKQYFDTINTNAKLSEEVHYITNKYDLDSLTRQFNESELKLNNANSELSKIKSFRKNSENHSVEDEPDLCIFCFNSPKEIIYECGHLLYCNKCYKVQKVKFNNCSMCSKIITKTYKIKYT